MLKSSRRIPESSAGDLTKKAISNALYGLQTCHFGSILHLSGGRWAVSFGKNDRSLAIFIGCTGRHLNIVQIQLGLVRAQDFHNCSAASRKVSTSLRFLSLRLPYRRAENTVMISSTS